MRVCSHCQKEVSDKAVACMYCGFALDENNIIPNEHIQLVENAIKPLKSKKIKISFVLLFIAFLMCLSAFSSLSVAQNVLEEQNVNLSYRIGFGIGFVLLQVIFSIIPLCFSLSERKKGKNIWNGIVLYCALFILLCALIQFFLVVWF